MAKTQNLSLNPTKISGTCGRLMCCLKYEQDAYEDALKRCPKNDSLVETPEGVGTVCQVNLLRETVKVRLDNAPEAPQIFPCEEIRVIRSGKGKRPEGYELPDPAERPTGLKKTAPPTPKAAQPERKPAQTDRKSAQAERKAEAAAAALTIAEEKDPSEKEKSHRSRRSRSNRNRGEGTSPAGGKKETQKEGKREGQTRPKPTRKERTAPASRRNGEEKSQEGAAPAEKKPGNPRRNNPHRPRRKSPPKPRDNGEG
jgi:hypothetical protein